MVIVRAVAKGSAISTLGRPVLFISR
ncbi:MAG: hypothetical protein QOK21_4545, partial [Solirubrobacteraceae bacterium]|nr:hypothetical protein [Solirubrobacteraceae bacterium]